MKLGAMAFGVIGIMGAAGLAGFVKQKLLTLQV